MKRFVLSIALLLLVVCESRAELIVNGGFESFTTSVGSNDINFGSFIRYFGPPTNASNTEITGWTLIGQNGANPNNVDLVDTSLYPSFAGSKSLDMEGDTVRSARIAIGGLATRPWRVPAAERVLAGKALTEQAAREAGDAALHGAKPGRDNAFRIELGARAVAAALMIAKQRA